jgi:hypothetical protein
MLSGSSAAMRTAIDTHVSRCAESDNCGVFGQATRERFVWHDASELIFAI